eukprot:3085028-Rhodomonas_salina.1
MRYCSTTTEAPYAMSVPDIAYCREAPRTLPLPTCRTMRYAEPHIARPVRKTHGTILNGSTAHRIAIARLCYLHTLGPYATAVPCCRLASAPLTLVPRSGSIVPYLSTAQLIADASIICYISTAHLVGICYDDTLAQYHTSHRTIRQMSTAHHAAPYASLTPDEYRTSHSAMP